MKKLRLWIAHIPYQAAKGRLREIYELIKGPGDNVDNIMLAHSLRPHTLEGHLALYKNVLHHYANVVPSAVREKLGVYVSALNGCDYCVDHHFAGLRRIMRDDAAADAFLAAVRTDAGFPLLPERERTALAYARALTCNPGGMIEAHVAAMRKVGWDDGEILEINQVVSYFAFANRTVMGLGVSSEGDILGLSPSGDGERDWSHR